MNEIEELIQRRRRQVLVNSYLYYQMNMNLIDDHTYDKWSKELSELQQKYPQESKNVKFYYEEFEDFDGSTGYHLPKDEWLHDLCFRLLTEHKRRKEDGI
ncbi:hypothetical protein BAOM_2993 [Peribacillus asahii]|uniref:Uncharacterized protein n=1 Tax=Peribacillus asahii TaxID=228899 RepID=A0A3Q9RP87_9BACI|nr:hypothetical protein [Peribacillus asahii]AZV43602.1 hypothetical protein BAOM_2993 [Peribacillus asahii]